MSRASSHDAPPSSLTSTRAIGARPDHARPSSAIGLPSTTRSRVKKSGQAGWHEERPRPHPRDRPSRLVLVLSVPVRRSPVDSPRTALSVRVTAVSHLTFVIPYQPGTTSRSGKPCCGGSGAPFISYASTAPLSRASASGRLRAYRCSMPPSSPAVERREHDLDGVGAGPCLVEQGGERDAAPDRRADRLGEPRLAQRSRLEERAAVPGALHRRRELDGRPLAELVEGVSRGCADRPAHFETPRGGIDERNVVVDEEVVEPDRGDRPAKRLERHRMVPCREAQLLVRDPALGRDAHRRATLASRDMTRPAPQSGTDGVRHCFLSTLAPDRTGSTPIAHERDVSPVERLARTRHVCP